MCQTVKVKFNHESTYLEKCSVLHLQFSTWSMTICRSTPTALWCNTCARRPKMGIRRTSRSNIDQIFQHTQIFEQFMIILSYFLSWKITSMNMMGQLLLPQWRTRAEGSSSRCGTAWPPFPRRWRAARRRRRTSCGRRTCGQDGRLLYSRWHNSVFSWFVRDKHSKKYELIFYWLVGSCTLNSQIVRACVVVFLH